MPQWILAVTALIAACTALIATIVGPLISWNITKKQISSSASIAENQIKASVVSVNRQTWINTLRDLISEYIALLADLSLHPGKVVSQGKRVGLIFYKIRILLNPLEEDHVFFVKLISANMSMIRDFVKEQNQQKKEEIIVALVDQRDEIVSLTQAILKREWERVKQGE